MQISGDSTLPETFPRVTDAATLAASSARDMEPMPVPRSPLHHEPTLRLVVVLADTLPLTGACSSLLLSFFCSESQRILPPGWVRPCKPSRSQTWTPGELGS